MKYLSAQLAYELLEPKHCMYSILYALWLVTQPCVLNTSICLTTQFSSLFYLKGIEDTASIITGNNNACFALKICFV